MSCNSCGDCCSVVRLQVTKADIRREIASGARTADHANSRWILGSLRRISRERALAIRPALGGEDLAQADARFMYVCRHFDYATRRCTNYEDRPPVCRDYPWYGEAPAAQRLLDAPRCGYWAEVPVWEADDAGLARVAPFTEDERLCA